MNINIVFGNKTLGKSTVVDTAKYPDLAVLTIEGYKGKGKTRRSLLNAKAQEFLGMEKGVSEVIILGEAITEEGENVSFITNVEAIGGAPEEMFTYKANGGLTKVEGEKFKTISSSLFAKNLIQYLDLADNLETTQDIELVLEESDNTPGVYQLVKMSLASVPDTECTNNCATPCAAHSVQQEEEVEEEFVAEAQLSGIDELTGIEELSTVEASGSDGLLGDTVENPVLKARRVFSEADDSQTWA